MKKSLLSLLFLFLLTATVAQAQPKAKFDSNEWVLDLTPFSKWSPMRVHTFTFVNEGDKPLVLYGYKAACGCTTVKFKSQPVLPGEKGYISVFFDVNSLRPGYFIKTINVTNNTDQGTFVLTLKGQLKKRGVF